MRWTRDSVGPAPGALLVEAAHRPARARAARAGSFRAVASLLHHVGGETPGDVADDCIRDRDGLKAQRVEGVAEETGARVGVEVAHTDPGWMKNLAKDGGQGTGNSLFTGNDNPRRARATRPLDETLSGARAARTGRGDGRGARISRDGAGRGLAFAGTLPAPGLARCDS